MMRRRDCLGRFLNGSPFYNDLILGFDSTSKMEAAISSRRISLKLKIVIAFLEVSGYSLSICFVFF